MALLFVPLAYIYLALCLSMAFMFYFAMARTSGLNIDAVSAWLTI